ncbi:MAG: UDP-2,3-diacylglucosamine diphosphatase [Flavobacteriales bacterium]|nr:UDP-2,3-diacylglucosamine diphosphatase [Flavobacteriales bacterium]
MEGEKKIYFASDFHLGAYVDRNIPSDRELKVVRWLDSIKDDCKELYLLGDVFDFWFEYKFVVPKGYVRLLGKLAELSDAGIPIHIFTGNHDIWMFGYFNEQFNAHIYKAPIERSWNGKTFIIGHGDGLGPGDEGYKMVKRLFTNRIAQRLFAMLHPYIGVNLARFFSRKSRETTGSKDAVFLGEDEYLIQYAKGELKSRHVDYFVFGHRHLVIDEVVGEGSRYINLGEWFTACNFGTFDGKEFRLQAFES